MIMQYELHIFAYAYLKHNKLFTSIIIDKKYANIVVRSAMLAIFCFGF